MVNFVLDKANASITLQEGFERLIRFKKMRNLSKETIRFYEDSFKYFGDYVDVSRQCSSITKEDYCGYIEHLQKNKNAIKILYKLLFQGNNPHPVFSRIRFVTSVAASSKDFPVVSMM